MTRKIKSALEKAIDLLSRQEQSSNTLRRKLLERGYDTNEINAAITTLTEKNYLNDADACAAQFDSLYAEERLSLRQICAKLVQRGFDPDTIKPLIPADPTAHEIAAATNALAKKFTTNADPKIKIKIRQHLAAKGFDPEIISAAAASFLDDDWD